jgi:dTDP-4-dehydrorhamnose reductase
VRVLVTGGAGLLGGAVLAAAPDGVDVHATAQRSPLDRAHVVDLADAVAVAGLLEALRPDAVVHTAYRAGDAAVLARDVVAATAAVARGCASVGARLVHVSSDVVFDGEHAPYAEDALPSPVHPYGQAKAVAEELVGLAVPDAAVVRTSLLVRADPPDPASARLLDGLRSGAPMTLFTDELRMPIAVEDLAEALWMLLGRPASEVAGPWHIVGPQVVSRHTLGVLLARRHGLEPDFPTASSRSHPQPRPRDLRLSTERAEAAGLRPRPVDEVLGR